MRINFDLANEILNILNTLKNEVEKNFKKTENDIMEFEKSIEHYKSEVGKITLQIFEIFKETKDD